MGLWVPSSWHWVSITPWWLLSYGLTGIVVTWALIGLDRGTSGTKNFRQIVEGVIVGTLWLPIIVMVFLYFFYCLVFRREP